MYPEGSHELEDRFQKALGPAAMNVAFTFLLHKVEYGDTELVLLVFMPFLLFAQYHEVVPHWLRLYHSAETNSTLSHASHI